MMSRPAALGLLSIALSVAACGSEDPGGIQGPNDNLVTTPSGGSHGLDAGHSSGGGLALGGSGSGGGNGGGSAATGGNCGAEEFTIDAVVPNVFISLDRSCSMKGPVGNPKWTAPVNAVSAMLPQLSGKVNWGLGLFPVSQGEACVQNTPQFQVKPGNEAGITQLLTNALQLSDPYYSDGPCVTNIDTAIQQASL